MPPSSAFQPPPTTPEHTGPSGAPTPPRPCRGPGRSPRARRPAPEGSRCHLTPAPPPPSRPPRRAHASGMRAPRAARPDPGSREPGRSPRPARSPPRPRPLTGQEREGQQQPVERGAEHVPLHARGARGAGRGSLCRRGVRGTWRAGRVVARAAPRGQDPRLGGGDPSASAAAAAAFSSASVRGPPSPLRCQPCPAAERSARLSGLAEAEQGRTAAGRCAPAPRPAGLYRLRPPPARPPRRARLRAPPTARAPRRPSTPRSPARTRPGKGLVPRSRCAQEGLPSSGASRAAPHAPLRPAWPERLSLCCRTRERAAPPGDRGGGGVGAAEPGPPPASLRRSLCCGRTVTPAGAPPGPGVPWGGR